MSKMIPFEADRLLERLKELQKRYPESNHLRLNQRKAEIQAFADPLGILVLDGPGFQLFRAYYYHSTSKSWNPAIKERSVSGARSVLMYTLSECVICGRQCKSFVNGWVCCRAHSRLQCMACGVIEDPYNKHHISYDGKPSEKALKANAPKPQNVDYTEDWTADDCAQDAPVES